MARKLKSKRAAHNMLRPLAFRNFFRNIQKIKNGLRPSFVRRSATPSRRGCLWAATRREKQEIENKLRPSSPRFASSFPPRGSLDERKGFPFLLNFTVSKMKQGEAFIIGNYLKIQIVCNNSFVKLPLIRPKLCFVHLPPGGKAISKAII